MGDRVRLRVPNGSEAGPIGLVFGWTTPSVTRVEVIGGAAADHAVNVVFDGEVGAWYAPDRLELVDHGPGTTIGIAGHSLVRTETGDWKRIAGDDRPRAEP